MTTQLAGNQSLAAILQLALVDPEPAPEETTPLALDIEGLPQEKFIRPRLPASKRQSMEDLSAKNAPPRLVRFGVIVESFDDRIVSEVTRDTLALIASLPPGKRLVVCSPNTGPLWEKMAAQLPVDFQFGGFELVPIWKVYWIHERPDPPAGIVPQFVKRVANPNVKRVMLKPGLESPMPVNPDANRMLPLGQSPSFRRQPTMAPVTMSPQLFLWSSRSPVAGEKVMIPETEEVENIVSITGTMAKVGSNHVALDMKGHEFFGALDVWAPRSYKKEDDAS